MMKTIYGHAVAVVAWLGEEEETDQQSLESMGKLVRALESHDQPQDQTGAHEVEQQPMAHSSLAVVADSDAGAIFADPRLPSDLPDADSPEWDHFLHLLEKPWFSRVWIVQELSLQIISSFFAVELSLRPGWSSSQLICCYRVGRSARKS